MKRYHLLRNNRESGPFTLRELKEVNLLPSDLLWIEGESTCWSHPEEIEELGAICSKSSVSSAAKPMESPSLFSSPDQPSETEETTMGQPAAVVPKPSFADLSKKYAEKTPQRRVRISSAQVGAGAFGLVILSLGVLMIVVATKDVISRINSPQPLATAEAQEIGSENQVQSSVAHAAFAGNFSVPAKNSNVLLSAEMPPKTDTAQMTQANSEPAPAPVAISKEKKIIIAKNSAKPNAKHSAALNAESTANAVNKTAESTEKKDTLATTPKPEESLATNEEQAEKKASAAGLQISANEYKTGFLGGVTDLELTVKNPTAKSIDEVTIAVDYLKPNGKVVHTQTVEVASLNPGEVKKVEVPNSSRGVSVRYRVVNR